MSYDDKLTHSLKTIVQHLHMNDKHGHKRDSIKVTQKLNQWYHRVDKSYLSIHFLSSTKATNKCKKNPQKFREKNVSTINAKILNILLYFIEKNPINRRYWNSKLIFEIEKTLIKLLNGIFFGRTNIKFNINKQVYSLSHCK